MCVTIPQAFQGFKELFRNIGVSRQLGEMPLNFGITNHIFITPLAQRIQA